MGIYWRGCNISADIVWAPLCGFMAGNVKETVNGYPSPPIELVLRSGGETYKLPSDNCEISMSIGYVWLVTESETRFTESETRFNFSFTCLVLNVKLKRNMFVNAVQEIRIHRTHFRPVSFFCESVSKLKPEYGSNPNKSNSHVLEKPK